MRARVNTDMGTEGVCGVRERWMESSLGGCQRSWMDVPGCGAAPARGVRGAAWRARRGCRCGTVVIPLSRPPSGCGMSDVCRGKRRRAPRPAKCPNTEKEITKKITSPFSSYPATSEHTRSTPLSLEISAPPAVLSDERVSSCAGARARAATRSSGWASARATSPPRPPR